MLTEWKDSEKESNIGVEKKYWESEKVLTNIVKKRQKYFFYLEL